MTKESLEKGNELNTLIEVTSEALKNITDILYNCNGNGRDDKNYEDDNYYLSIYDYTNSGGKKACLNRYKGNTELLEVIKSTLEKQLAFYKDELNKL